MLVDRRRRLVPISRGDQTHNPSVLAPIAARAARLARLTRVDIRRHAPAPELVAEANEVCVGGAGDERTMERSIGRELAVEVVARLVGGAQRRLKGRDRLRVTPLSRKSGGRGLENSSCLVIGLDVALGELGDYGAPVQAKLDQPLGGETVERLAKRRPRDPELAGEGLLAKLLSRGEAPAQDERSQPAVSLIDKTFWLEWGEADVHVAAKTVT